MNGRRALLAFLLLSGLAPSAAGATRRGGVGDERWLEGRLIAPCCWTQTLDVHESPLAQDLRNEIHARLLMAEDPTAIEDDLATRYGERIRALPRGRDPRHLITAFVALVVVISGIALARLARRWTHGERIGPQAADALTVRDAFDDRLDAELRDLDE